MDEETEDKFPRYLHMSLKVSGAGWGGEMTQGREQWRHIQYSSTLNHRRK